LLEAGWRVAALDLPDQGLVGRSAAILGSRFLDPGG
jgi:hypothetical protein